jgi:hypothetical protein
MITDGSPDEAATEWHFAVVGVKEVVGGIRLGTALCLLESFECRKGVAVNGDEAFFAPFAAHPQKAALRVDISDAQ